MRRERGKGEGRNVRDASPPITPIRIPVPPVLAHVKPVDVNLASTNDPVVSGENGGDSAEERTVGAEEGEESAGVAKKEPRLEDPAEK